MSDSDSLYQAGKDAEIAAADKALLNEGKAFERAINQLRDEYHTRHKEH